MEIESPRISRLATFIAVLVWLVAMAVGLGAMMFITSRAASEAEGPTRAYLVRLAWLSVALMGMLLVVLAYVVIRFVRSRLVPPAKLSPTPYVNAWAEAGRRFKLPPDEDDQDEQETPD